jgi:hypothetical protein
MCDTGVFYVRLGILFPMLVGMGKRNRKLQWRIGFPNRFFPNEHPNAPPEL